MPKSDAAPKPAPAAAPAPAVNLRAPNPAQTEAVIMPQDPLAAEAHALLNPDFNAAMEEWGKTMGAGQTDAGQRPDGPGAAPVAPAADTPPAPAAPAAAAPPPPAPDGPGAAPAPAPTQDVVEMVRAEAARQREIEAAKAEARAAAERERTAAQKLADLEARLAADPDKVLAEKGWDMENLNRRVLQGATPDAVRVNRLEAELKALKDAQAARDREQATAAEAAQASRSIEQFKDTAVAQLSAVKDQFPLTHAFLEPQELREALYDVMSQEYQASGGTTRLTPAQAATRLESQLTARATRLKAILGTPSTAAVPPAPKPTVPPATITNATASQTPDPSVDPLDNLMLSPAELARVGAQMLIKANAQ